MDIPSVKLIQDIIVQLQGKNYMDIRSDGLVVDNQTCKDASTILYDRGIYCQVDSGCEYPIIGASCKLICNASNFNICSPAAFR